MRGLVGFLSGGGRGAARTPKSRRGRIALAAGVGALLVSAIAMDIAAHWFERFEKRVAVVIPGQLVRGAWQHPGPLRRIIAREKIKTIVTLAEIGTDHPRYIDQARVVSETGVRWIIVPIHGSVATLDQMSQAADLLADPRLRPIYFHCVAGHHRTSQALAAYRIRHEGWSADRAWAEVSAMPWARPDADVNDRRMIREFAERCRVAVAPGPGRTR